MVKQPVKKYFQKKNAFQWDAYCTDHQLTVAKPNTPLMNINDLV